ncbi:AAA family ATPase [Arthrobacter globiformis]|uniref:AAA family ATPase n=1 Tax=Arthrobacter globiformis TaxID=1665 RepID=UPI001552AF08|nr:AAA family ATPase [Arthrobacter globiformis]
MTQEAETPQDLPSWAPIDLTSVLNGTHKAPQPTYMEREDGVCLGYPALVHALNGESESMKSLVAQAESARSINEGIDVLYIDCESDQGAVVDRLLMLGAKPERIRDNFHYVRPQMHPGGTTQERLAFRGLLQGTYGLAVIDGVTEAFAIFGVKSTDNDEVTAWGRQVPRTIADHIGAAVFLIDHVTKSEEGRGRFAIGAQAKLSYLTGAAYGLEVIEPGGVGMVGRIAIRVGKDRPGQVRPNAGAWRKSDRTQEVAVAVFDSTEPGRIHYRLEAPRTGTESNGPDWQPTELMEQASQALQDAGKPLTYRAISACVRGKQTTIRTAVDELIRLGHITTSPGPRNATMHTLIKPYPAGETLTELKAV